MKNLSIICAKGINNEIGLNNKLLWHIKEDLEFYKNMTIGKNIIMGRNTFESMPPNALKDRNPIVLSSKQIDFVTCYKDINLLLENIEKSEEEFLVVGGARVYYEFLEYVDTMYLTQIYKSFNADTYFPTFDYNCWDETLIKDCMDYELPYKRKVYKRKR